MMQHRCSIKGAWSWAGCAAMAALGACSPQKTTLRDQREPTVVGQESSQRQNSCLNIVGGQETDAFPAVYQIYHAVGDRSRNACTGTFVSDNTLVTAAHCMPVSGLARDLELDLSQSTPSSTQSEDVQALRIIYPSQCGPSPRNASTRVCEEIGDDVAIVIFPDRTAAQWLPVSITPVPLKTPVTIVGYGQTSVDFSSSSPPIDGNIVRKKFGTNTLTQIFPNPSPLKADATVTDIPSTYAIVGWQRDGEAAARGQDTAVPARGDSGGPLIVKDAVIGVVSSGLDASGRWPNAAFDVIGIYASLASKTSQALLHAAEAAGARITYAERDRTPAPPKKPETIVASASNNDARKPEANCRRVTD